jgi:hypothetical protein
MAGTKSMALRDLQAWCDVVTDAVGILLRQAERRMNEDSKVVFASRDTGAVLLLQAEQEKVRELRDQLRSLRATSRSLAKAGEPL